MKIFENIAEGWAHLLNDNIEDGLKALGRAADELFSPEQQNHSSRRQLSYNDFDEDDFDDDDFDDDDDDFDDDDFDDDDLDDDDF